MKNDRVPLELIAPVLSLIGSLISLVSAVFDEDRTIRGVLSATLGTLGSALWLATAVDAYQRESLDAEPVASGDPIGA